MPCQHTLICVSGIQPALTARLAEGHERLSWRAQLGHSTLNPPVPPFLFNRNNAVLACNSVQRLVAEVGVGIRLHTENRQVIDSVGRTIRNVIRSAGFAVQNRVQFSGRVGSKQEILRLAESDLAIWERLPTSLSPWRTMRSGMRNRLPQ